MLTPKLLIRYKRDEQSKRFAAFLSAGILAGAVGGLIAGGIESSLNERYGIAGWRWLFIVEGTVTAGWSLVSAFLLPDFPHNSRRFKNRERELAVHRILSDEQTVGSKGVHMGHRRALAWALKDWKIWAFSFGFMVGSFTAPMIFLLDLTCRLLSDQIR